MKNTCNNAEGSQNLEKQTTLAVGKQSNGKSRIIMKTIHHLIFILVPLLATLNIHAQEGSSGVFLTFTSPTPNQRWGNAAFNVVGTLYVTNTYFNQPVFVLVSTDTINWTNAISANGFTNWTARIVVAPGTNTIYAQVEWGPRGNPVSLAVYYTTLVYVTNKPLLTISRSIKKVILSWPTSFTGWTLQTNGSPGITNWGNYTGTIVNNSVTNSPPKGTLFFRLTEP
jgi:hypothetical protein